MDYSLFDDPSIVQLVFYPRRDWTPAPSRAIDYLIPVGDGISVLCRFYRESKDFPTIIYFHGNGEVVSDHDWIALLYNQIGVNLVVADYRGYGRSGGQPTFSNTISDAHTVLKYILRTLKSDAYNEPIFVMGRSLGSISAVELAAKYPEKINGLILESGFGGLGRLVKCLSLPISIPGLSFFETKSFEQVRGITVPVLVIHGERDTIVPYIEGKTFYANVGSKYKKLLIIPEADHNNVLLKDTDEYFAAIREFIFCNKETVT